MKYIKQKIRSESLKSSKTRSSSTVGKKSQAIIDNFWSKVSKRDSAKKHFVYQSRHSSAPKPQSEKSRSIEINESTFNQKKREHFLHNLSDFTKMRTSFHDSKKSELSNLKVRRMTIQEPTLSKPSNISSSFVKHRPRQTESDKKQPLTKQQSSERTLMSRPSSINVYQEVHKKEAETYQTDLVVPSKLAPAQTNSKYTLPNSFVYMPKAFKPSKTKAKEQLINLPQYKPLEASESNDQSTEDMKYRFAKFNSSVNHISLESINPSSSSRTSSYNVESLIPEIKVLRPDERENQLKFDSNKKILLSSDSSVDTKPAFKVLAKEPHQFQIFNQKQQVKEMLVSQKPKESKPTKLTVTSGHKQEKITFKAIDMHLDLPDYRASSRRDDSESIRLINHEIDRMIHGLKQKHRQTQLISHD